MREGWHVLVTKLIAVAHAAILQKVRHRIVKQFMYWVMWNATRPMSPCELCRDLLFSQWMMLSRKLCI